MPQSNTCSTLSCPKRSILPSNASPISSICSRANSSGGVPDPNQPAAARVTFPIHSLFESALELAALQQLNNQPERAATALADLDRALPATIAPDEAIYIAADRQRYALLGTHFPALPGAVSLLPATDTPPSQPKFGSATIFLLFPPWCAQCIRQAQQIVATLVTTAIARGPVAQNDVHIYGLLAAVPPAPLAAPPPKVAAHASAAERTTPVWLPSIRTQTPINLRRNPHSTSFERRPRWWSRLPRLRTSSPTTFLSSLQRTTNGIIRLMVSPAPKNALNQNGPLDQLTDTILQHWPPASAH